jgi:hypothetical protein
MQAARCEGSGRPFLVFEIGFDRRDESGSGASIPDAMIA